MFRLAAILIGIALLTPAPLSAQTTPRPLTVVHVGTIPS
jgi:hypothetical protein